MTEFFNNSILPYFMGDYWYLAYLILNIVASIVLKFIWELNERMSAKLGFQDVAHRLNCGWYPLVFCWWGQLGSIVMIFFYLPVFIGAICMIGDLFNLIIDFIIDTIAGKKTPKLETIKE